MSPSRAAEFGVSGIRVVFGARAALDDVTLTVVPGAVTAVVGGDGAGKSTLLRVFAGRVPLARGEVTSLPKAEIGYQPATSGVWESLTVTENINFVGNAFGMPPSRVRARSDELLQQAGLTDARGRLGRELSGGMRQKLGFVLAILHEPRLLLLDEPSTGVDPVSRVELWRLIAAEAARGTAIAMATTYLDEAARAASVAALDSGRVIASGTPDEILASVAGRICGIPEAAADDLSWRRGNRRHRWLPPGTDAAGGEPVAVDLEDALIALTLAGHARELSRQPSPAPARSVPAPGPAGQILASATHVTRRFGRRVAVDDVSLDVAAGEIVGLIGANGAGKTTFLRALIGLDRPDAGDTLLFGRPPSMASRPRLGYVPQGLGLYRNISVAANADFFARVYDVPRSALPPGLNGHEHDIVSALGLGRQRQFAFSLALAHHPDLLVLDEPTSGVDPLSRARLWDVIHDHADAGCGVIVTTHYLQEAQQCTRLVLMSQGRVVGTGSVAELTAGISAVLVTSPQWQVAFAALSTAGLPTMLTGRSIRVAGVSAEVVRTALGALPATIAEVTPTLEEAMVLLEA